jgi:hypothetical protein
MFGGKLGMMAHLFLDNLKRIMHEGTLKNEDIRDTYCASLSSTNCTPAPFSRTTPVIGSTPKLISSLEKATFQKKKTHRQSCKDKHHYLFPFFSAGRPQFDIVDGRS